MPCTSCTERIRGRGGWFEGSVMSAQDDGGGPGSGRSTRENEVFGHPLDAAQHFFSQSDPHSPSRSNSNNLGTAPSLQTWGNNALNAQQSEVSLMAQGAGRP